ncbi:MAG: hypothetical protein Q4A75_09640 [Peptostreptococcaceae bacterium]|nr:hypothetical protein [Peptostreptococcaceae bacterium]
MDDLTFTKIWSAMAGMKMSAVGGPKAFAAGAVGALVIDYMGAQFIEKVQNEMYAYFDIN